MIVWVDRRLQRWGVWKRGDLDIGYGESPIARMMRGNVEQSLDGSSTPRLYVDDTEAIQTDAAIAALPEPLPRLMVVWYGSESSAAVVARRFRVCRRTVYLWLDRAHAHLAGQWSDDRRKNH